VGGQFCAPVLPGLGYTKSVGESLLSESLLGLAKCSTHGVDGFG
jgi:hypothetical protein